MATIEEISDAFYSYSYKKFTEEVENSDKPDQKHFPSKSEFSNDFQNKINAVYNKLNHDYPPEQATYIYKTLMANLHKQSENPGQSKFINFSKGTINVENLNTYSKKVEETLKSRHPEKFQTENTKLAQETSVNDNKKVVDFNSTEDKQQAFDNLFEEYSKLKTKEQKINYIKNKICYNWDELSPEQQKLFFDATEVCKNYTEFKKKYNKEYQTEEDLNKVFLVDNPEITETQLKESLNFISDYKELSDLKSDPENIKDPKLKKRMDELQENVDKYMNEHTITQKDVDDIINEDQKLEVETAIFNFDKIPGNQTSTEKKELSFEDMLAGNTATEINFEKVENNIQTNDSTTSLNNTEEITQLLNGESLEGPKESKNTENELENDKQIDLPDSEKEITNNELKKNENNSNIKSGDIPIPENTNDVKNQVLYNVLEKDFQDDYTQEIKENSIIKFIRENIINRFKKITTPKLDAGQPQRPIEDTLKEDYSNGQDITDLFEGKTNEIESTEKNSLATQNRFSKFFNNIRGTLLNFINPKRKTQELNDVKAIDTAQNNTPNKLDDYVKVSISQEKQRDNAFEFKNSTKKEKNTTIEVNKGDALNL